MKNIETKDIVFELKDMDKQKRTAVIAHAVYDNIDRGKDVSRKGMFNKSWQENKGDISFYLNHNDEQAPGKVVDVFEDNQRAYTKAWLGTHTLGNDTLIMMDEGIIKKSSFGYITEKSNPLSIKGQMVRELKEVAHIETSVLTKMPMNPLAEVVSVTKMFDVNDVNELAVHIKTMERFCKNTKASDECIKNILFEIENIKAILLKYNTANTQKDDDPIEPVASGNNKAGDALYLLTLKL